MMTTKATINGKNQDEVFAALRKEFPKEALDRDYQGHLYVKMSAVEDRLNEVLGFNYSNNILQSKVETILGIPYFLFDCKLTIRDDNGNVVCERSSAGGTQVRLATKGDNKGLPVDAAEDYKSAVQTAIKKAARSLGVGAYLSEDGSTTPKQGSNNVSAGNAPPKQVNTPEILSFKVLAKPNTHSKSVKVDVVIPDNGERGELILWNREADTLDAKIVNAFKVLNPGQTLCCEVIRGQFRNTTQFSIQKFVQRAS